MSAGLWIFKDTIRCGKVRTKQSVKHSPGWADIPGWAHPYHFVLLECSYLHEWYDNEESLRIPLDEIPDDQISFTLGDSCAKYAVKDTLEVFTKETIREKPHAFDDSLEKLLESIPPFRYVEAQVWFRPEA